MCAVPRGLAVDSLLGDTKIPTVTNVGGGGVLAAARGGGGGCGSWLIWRHLGRSERDGKSR